MRAFRLSFNCNLQKIGSQFVIKKHGDKKKCREISKFERKQQKKTNQLKLGNSQQKKYFLSFQFDDFP